MTSSCSASPATSTRDVVWAPAETQLPTAIAAQQRQMPSDLKCFGAPILSPPTAMASIARAPFTSTHHALPPSVASFASSIPNPVNSYFATAYDHQQAVPPTVQTIPPGMLAIPPPPSYSAMPYIFAPNSYHIHMPNPSPHPSQVVHSCYQVPPHPHSTCIMTAAPQVPYMHPWPTHMAVPPLAFAPAAEPVHHHPPLPLHPSLQPLHPSLQLLLPSLQPPPFVLHASEPTFTSARPAALPSSVARGDSTNQTMAPAADAIFSLPEAPTSPLLAPSQEAQPARLAPPPASSTPSTCTTATIVPAPLETVAEASEFPYEPPATHSGSKLGSKVKQGWSCEEDQFVLDFVSRVGPRWSLLAANLEGRTDDSVRNRYLRLMRKGTDQDAGIRLQHERGGDMWTADEDERIIEAVQKYGQRWKTVATFLHGRSACAVRNRFLRCGGAAIVEPPHSREDSAGSFDTATEEEEADEQAVRTMMALADDHHDGHRKRNCPDADNLSAERERAERRLC
mmetsp:Transcript_11731/g.30090  ORF Transcript_11731/g.30090 Transcript_11731/m.30090 type:complete len:510 (-) Transcript_11731:123-1652(-)